MITASYNIYFKSFIPTISENEFLMSFATKPTTSESTSVFSVFAFTFGTMGYTFFGSMKGMLILIGTSGNPKCLILVSIFGASFCFASI